MAGLITDRNIWRIYVEYEKKYPTDTKGHIILKQELIRKNAKSDDTYEGPVVWRGFDMSLVVVARAKLIMGLLKQADICSEQVLQIWYSSCLTHVTVQLFFLHLAGKEQDLVLKKLMLLWSSAKLDANKAAARWSQALALVDLRGIHRLAGEGDRVFYSRYLLTGHLFLPENSSLTGNPTFFCLPQGYKKQPVENIFLYNSS